MVRKLYKLDEKIDLAGRITTIREQWKRDKVRAKAEPGKNPLRHWVEIEKDDPRSTEEFDISEADFKTLESRH